MNRLCLCAMALTALSSPALAAGDAAPFGSAVAMGAGELGAITGRADIAQSITASNTSSVSQNVTNGDTTTGAISFDGTTFQGMSGLSVVSANTGNNVAINASMNVNVSIQP